MPYRISFSQRTTFSTSFGTQVEKGSRYFYLKAVRPRSAQKVGYATILPNKTIQVTTCDHTLVGYAKTRKEAGRLIDAWHRKHNKDAYWLWADDELV